MLSRLPQAQRAVMWRAQTVNMTSVDGENEIANLVGRKGMPPTY
jgi:hypothetical protein